MVLVLHGIQVTVGHPDPEAVAITLDIVHLAADLPVYGVQDLILNIGHGEIHGIGVPIVVGCLIYSDILHLEEDDLEHCRYILTVHSIRIHDNITDLERTHITVPADGG